MEASPGAVTKACLAAALEAVIAAEEELARLDAVAGAGDHARGMVRGFRAAVAATDEFDGPAREVLTRAGAAFGDAAGGASGALLGVWLSAMGQALPSDAEIDASAVARALGAGQMTVQRVGKAWPGDKTLLDTLDPFVRAYTAAAQERAGVAEAWQRALPAAEQGMRATADMVGKRGRAAYPGERSRGLQGPGATAMCYILRAAGDAMEEMSGGEAPHI